jgi:carbon storage regulator
MLVLSRQRDEAIIIGDDVEITIVDIRGDKVRLGITAPTSITVHRKEVYAAITQENEKASQMKSTDISEIVRTLAPPGRKKDIPAAAIVSRPKSSDLRSSA